MFKPRVTLENQERVYRYYEKYRRNQTLARLGHAAMNRDYKPRVSYVGDAEARLEELLAQGKQLIIGPNHLTDKDQYVVAAMARQERVLNPLMGRTFIPSKAVLFKPTNEVKGLPAKAKYYAQRRGIDVMGAIPAFRDKDVRNDGTELPPNVKELQRTATGLLIATCISRLNRGEHMAIFREGERHPGPDFHLVQDPKIGLGLIACGVNRPENLALVNVGMWYGDLNSDEPLRKDPLLVIDEPIEDLPDVPADVIDLAQFRFQQTVGRAVEEAAAA